MRREKGTSTVEKEKRSLRKKREKYIRGERKVRKRSTRSETEGVH